MRRWLQLAASITNTGEHEATRQHVQERKKEVFFLHSAQVSSGPSVQEHCRSLGATGMQRAIRDIQEKTTCYLQRSQLCLLNYVSCRPQLVGRIFWGKQLHVFFPLASPISETHGWMVAGLQGPLPWPYKMLLRKQNKTKDAKTLFQNQKHTGIAVSGQTWLCPKPGKPEATQ